jgi:hypothetical protein
VHREIHGTVQGRGGEMRHLQPLFARVGGVRAIGAVEWVGRSEEEVVVEAALRVLVLWRVRLPFLTRPEAAFLVLVEAIVDGSEQT